MSDARLLNWRFLVPSEPRDLLHLPLADERVPRAIVPQRSPSGLSAALARGPYGGVSAPDLAGWQGLADGRGALGLLAGLARSVDSGGWLYAGFPNSLYPGRSTVAGAMRLRQAVRILKRQGLSEIQSYLAFPDQTCPAYLLPLEGRSELDYFLRRLAFPFVQGAAGRRARLKQRGMQLMRRAALAGPHRIRVRFAPAVAVVAWRHP
jgi:hypothetical protein